MTAAQERNLSTLWHVYALEEKILDFGQIFGRRAPVYLEIGFGTGKFLISQAKEHPEVDFIGIEVHRPGVGQLLGELQVKEIGNVRVFCADAVEVLRTQIQDHALTRVYILFPDPWPKRKHYKRRLVQPEFVELLHKKVKPEGLVHLATDWEEYATQIKTVFSEVLGWKSVSDTGGSMIRNGYTRFETRGIRLGHSIQDLVFVRSFNE
ncbi:tRNA (guanine-N(7)-)-methyltransferase [Gammaproteobacteria bacterium]